MSKRKGKRGRPKLPKHKLKVYKHVYKGVQYITRQLKKYFPNKYKSHSDRLVRARFLFNDITSGGDKINLKSINEYERTHRKKAPSGPDTSLPAEVDFFPYWEHNNSSDYGSFNGIFFGDKQVSVTFANDGLHDDYSFVGTGEAFCDAFYGSTLFKHFRLYYNESEVGGFIPKQYKSGVYEFEMGRSDGSGPRANTKGKSKDAAPGLATTDIDKQITLKEKEIELSKLQLQKADKLLELLKAGVPYADAKKILGL